MGWREDGELEKALRYLCHGVGSNEEVFVTLLSMPPADCIALARELLAGTRRVVAGEVESVTPESVPWRYGDLWHGVQDGADEDALAAICDGYADGWNACRAAMLEDP